MSLAKSMCAFAGPAIRMTAALAAATFTTQFAVAQNAHVTPSTGKLRVHRRLVVKPTSRHGGATYNDPANGMVVTSGVSALNLATTLVGAGVTISGTPTLQGDPSQAGTFSNAPALVGFNSGIILSSGKVSDAASTYAGEDLPDTSLASAGYAPLSALINGQETNDASVLQFSFVPTTATIYFSYVFASAEYPNFVGQYNDPMGLFVNGTGLGNNVAILPTVPPVAVTINNVNTGANPAFFNKYNSDGDALPFGGETKVLTATATVTPGQVNTITLAIADALDDELDSAVFIQANSLTTTPPVQTGPVGVPVLSPWMMGALVIGLLASGLLFLRRLNSDIAHR